MLNDKFFFVGVYLFSVFISSLSQIMLKLAAQKTYPSRLKEYLNPMVIGAYTLFFCTTLLTMFALTILPLSTGVALESTGYIFVGVLSYFILKERFSKRRLLGIMLIFLGILVYTI